MSSRRRSSFKPTLVARGSDRPTVSVGGGPPPFPARKISPGLRWSSNQEEIIVTKGHGQNGTLKISMVDLRQRLQRLREIHQLNIRTLTGDDKDVFEQITHYVSILYDTEYYPVIHRMITEVFGDLTSVQPGTVGAYFAGCLLNTSFNDKPGCSVICASSAPPPEGTQSWRFCDHCVIWAVYGPDGKFMFTELNSVPDKTNCYVFIQYDDLKKFPKFSEAEVKALMDYGEGDGKIKNINLVSYSQDGKTYKEHFRGFVPLDQWPLPFRPEVDIEPTPLAGLDKGKNTGLIILLVVLILIALYVGYRFYASRKYNT